MGQRAGHRLGASCAAACLLVLCVACGPDPAPAFHLRGRFEGLLGEVPDGIHVMASRDGLPVLDELEGRREGAAFDLVFRGDAPVDLQLALLPLVVPPAGVTPADWLDRLAQDKPRRDRQVFAVNGWEACLTQVRPGGPPVVLRARRQVLAQVHLRCLDVDGSPLEGARIRLASLADWVEATSGADGGAAIADLPVREWRVEVSPPQVLAFTRVCGLAALTPGGQHVESPLRRPVMVRVQPTRVPDGRLFLAISDPRVRRITTWGWSPDASGGMDLPIDPEWQNVRVELQRVKAETPQGLTSEILCAATVPVTTGSVATLEIAQ